MKRILNRGLGLAICLALALSLVLPATVMATYPIAPTQFIGTASVDGEAVEDGTVITGWAENLATHELEQVGFCETETVSNMETIKGFYSMEVYFDLDDYSEEIHFKIGDLWATQTANCHWGWPVETDLTAFTGAPTVTGVDPDHGDQGETLDVTITGTSFSGATSVSFGAGITINDFNVDSDTQITANISIASDATPGARDVSVTTPDGTGTLPNGFTVVEVVPGAPTVTAVNPNQGNQGETLDVTITGTNFGGATSVGFGAGITVNSYTVNSATQIDASISIAADATPGPRDVSVTTASGVGTLVDGFTVIKPGETIQLYLGVTIVPVYPGIDIDLPANLPDEAVMVWHQVTADEATPEIPAGTWLHWAKGVPPEFNSLNSLENGKAYLISATADCVWAVPTA